MVAVASSCELRLQCELKAKIHLKKLKPKANKHRTQSGLNIMQCNTAPEQLFWLESLFQGMAVFSILLTSKTT